MFRINWSCSLDSVLEAIECFLDPYAQLLDPYEVLLLCMACQQSCTHLLGISHGAQQSTLALRY
jgi:hypothetical protein